MRAFPSSSITWDVDEKRQAIVDSWPEDVDDTAARRDWGFAPRVRLRVRVRRLSDSDDQGALRPMRLRLARLHAGGVPGGRGPCLRASGRRSIRRGRTGGTGDEHAGAATTSGWCWPWASTTPTTWTPTTARPIGRRSEKRPLGDIDATPRRSRRSLRRIRRPPATSWSRLRHRYLTRQLVGAAHAHRDALGHEAHLRRGIEGALRRRGAGQHVNGTSSACSPDWSDGCPGPGPLADRYDAFRSRYVIPQGPARRHVPRRHRRLPDDGRWRTSRCRPTRASPSSTSPTRAGAATTGTRATIAA